MFAFPEFIMAFALVSAFLFLGLLMVCIPRVRKKGFFSAEDIAKVKREADKVRTRNNARKKMEKSKKRSAKEKKRLTALREKTKQK